MFLPFSVSVIKPLSQYLENVTFCILDKRVLQVVTLKNRGPLWNQVDEMRTHFTQIAQLRYTVRENDPHQGKFFKFFKGLRRVQTKGIRYRT